MQIHFYDQWDKPSTNKSNTEPPKGKGLTKMIKQVALLDGNRIQLFFIAVGIVTAFIFSYLIFAGDYGQAGAHQQVEVFKPQDLLYTVQKGDTLWSIAVQHYPELTTEEAINKIQQKNGLGGTTIQAGQTIWLP